MKKKVNQTLTRHADFAVYVAGTRLKGRKITEDVLMTFGEIDPLPS